MMSTLLLAALAVSVAGAVASRRWRTFGQVLMVVGVVSLAAIAAVQIRQIIFPPQPKTADRGEMAVSYSLAKCVLGDLAGQSGTVILLFPPRTLMDADTEECCEDGFVRPFSHGRGTFHLKAILLEGKPGNAGYDFSRRWRKPRTPWRLFPTPDCRRASIACSQPGNRKFRASTYLNPEGRPIGSAR